MSGELFRKTFADPYRVCHCVLLLEAPILCQTLGLSFDRSFFPAQ